MSSIIHMPLSEMEALIEENLQTLSQLRYFVAELSPEPYRQALGDHGRHTLGKHIRHIIDHYDALLGEGTLPATATIDYEHRQRDTSLEQSPSRAAQRLAWIESRLQTLKQREPVHDAIQLVYPAGGSTLDLESSLGRELAFLTSHTIHHMAIIGLLAESLGIGLPEDFGVHPSTLRHWRREAAALSARSA
ncbi:DinB family protein [Litchfieldella rifensis]|uniref:DinB family protein n=1 Tax=Litchfieldella rifensis TaxID=762643 RepID=A0ABV7LR23_9GAMM